jgi:hypothetical protein
MLQLYCITFANNIIKFYIRNTDSLNCLFLLVYLQRITEEKRNLEITALQYWRRMLK